MSAADIYNRLRAAGLSAAGACGLMGNLKAESSMISNIAQRGLTELSDGAYTAMFDRSPAACVRDEVGYGLAQWTYPSRKQGLWDFAKARGKSVGDEAVQTDYIIHELKNEFTGLWSFLCATGDIYSAADRVCREYERPAINNVEQRSSYAMDYYEQFCSEEPGDKWYPPDLSLLVLQSVLVANGYSCDITGYKDRQFLGTLREFVTDIGG